MRRKEVAEVLGRAQDEAARLAEAQMEACQEVARAVQGLQAASAALQEALERIESLLAGIVEPDAGAVRVVTNPTWRTHGG